MRAFRRLTLSAGRRVHVGFTRQLPEARRVSPDFQVSASRLLCSAARRLKSSKSAGLKSSSKGAKPSSRGAKAQGARQKRQARRQKRQAHEEQQSSSKSEEQQSSSKSDTLTPFLPSRTNRIWAGWWLVAGSNAAIWGWWEDQEPKWKSDSEWRADYKERRLEGLAVGGLDGLHAAHSQIPALARHFYLSYSNLHHEGLHVLITHGFSHSDPAHLAGNIALLINAVPLAVHVGFGRVAIAYLAGIIWGGLAGLLEAQYRPEQLHMSSLGASAGVCAVITMLAVLYPRTPIVMFGIFDGLQASHVLALFGVYDVLQLAVGTQDGIGHGAHVAGMMAGGALLLGRRSRIAFVVVTAAVVCQVISFKNDLFSRWQEDFIVRQRLGITHEALNKHDTIHNPIQADLVLSSPFNPLWASAQHNLLGPYYGPKP